MNEKPLAKSHIGCYSKVPWSQIITNETLVNVIVDCDVSMDPRWLCHFARIFPPCTTP